MGALCGCVAAATIWQLRYHLGTVKQDMLPMSLGAITFCNTTQILYITVSSPSGIDTTHECISDFIVQ